MLEENFMLSLPVAEFRMFFYPQQPCKDTEILQQGGDLLSWFDPSWQPSPTQPHTCSLPHQWDGGENWKGKSEKNTRVEIETV